MASARANCFYSENWNMLNVGKTVRQAAAQRKALYSICDLV